MTVLIDSWAWIEYWKGSENGHRAAQFIESDEEAYVSAINLIEVYSWFAKEYSETAAKERINKIENRCNITALDKDIAMGAATLKLKHKLGIADSVVLATARSLDAKVVTGDPDFQKIDGVSFIG